MADPPPLFFYHLVYENINYLKKREGQESEESQIIYTCTLAKYGKLKGYEIHNLGKGPYGHHNHTDYLSPPAVEVERKIFYQTSKYIIVHYMAIPALPKGLHVHPLLRNSQFR